MMDRFASCLERNIIKRNEFQMNGLKRASNTRLIKNILSPPPKKNRE